MHFKRKYQDIDRISEKFIHDGLTSGISMLIPSLDGSIPIKVIKSIRVPIIFNKIIGH